METVGLNSQFWRGKHVFLTGHTGFKGSWLSLWLRKLGAEVTGYALAPPTNPNLFAIGRVDDGMRSIIADVRDAQLLAASIQEAKPDIVIHMAAQALVRHSYVDPLGTYSTNVMGTANLLDAVRHAPSVRAVLNVTSDKCYENKEWIWGYRENEPMGGFDPYSSSKGCAEIVTAAYRNSFFAPDTYGNHGVAIATARAGNVIGGGDWATDRLIPDILRAISANQPVMIRSPSAIRPWQHVLEPLAGYLMLAEKLFCDGARFGEGWNFGPAESDARPVSWIADRLTSQWGEGASWVSGEQSGVHEAQQLRLDCAKAHLRLGWSAHWPLETALDRIIDWHRAYVSGADMTAKTIAQIQEFTANE